jgi:hypothetical protein
MQFEYKLWHPRRGGNERNITKSLADRFWADHAQTGNCPTAGHARRLPRHFALWYIYKLFA